MPKVETTDIYSYNYYVLSLHDLKTSMLKLILIWYAFSSYLLRKIKTRTRMKRDASPQRWMIKRERAYYRNEKDGNLSTNYHQCLMNVTANGLRAHWHSVSHQTFQYFRSRNQYPLEEKTRAFVTFQNRRLSIFSINKTYDPNIKRKLFLSAHIMF